MTMKVITPSIVNSCWAPLLLRWIDSACPLVCLLKVWLCRPPVIRTPMAKTLTVTDVSMVIGYSLLLAIRAALYIVIGLKKTKMNMLFRLRHLQGRPLLAQLQVVSMVVILTGSRTYRWSISIRVAFRIVVAFRSSRVVCPIREVGVKFRFMSWIGLIWMSLALWILLSQLPKQPILTRRVRVISNVSRVVMVMRTVERLALAQLAIFKFVIMGVTVVGSACG